MRRGPPVSVAGLSGPGVPKAYRVSCGSKLRAVERISIRAQKSGGWLCSVATGKYTLLLPGADGV